MVKTSTPKVWLVGTVDENLSVERAIVAIGEDERDDIYLPEAVKAEVEDTTWM